MTNIGRNFLQGNLVFDNIIQLKKKELNELGLIYDCIDVDYHLPSLTSCSKD